MTELKVEGMHCENCVKRILTALTEAKIFCEVSLETKTVRVEDGKREDAIGILDDLGFEV